MSWQFLIRLRRSFYSANFYPGAPWMLLGALVLTALFHPALPADDALRHVVSYAWGYDHRAMYPLSTLPGYNLYPTFDRAVGWLSQAVGPLATVKLLQALSVALVSTALYRIASLALPDGPRRPLDATVLVLFVLCAGVMHRAMLARPEVLAFGWAALALSLPAARPRLSATVFVAGGVLVSSGYWMAWVYWPLVLFAPFTLRWRMAVVALLTAAHLAYWHFVSQGDYWNLLSNLNSWHANRLIAVSENKGILSALAHPTTWVFIALVVLGMPAYRLGRRRRLVDLGTASLAFAAVNMIRYLGALLAAWLPVAARGWAQLRLPSSAVAFLAVAMWLQTLYSIEVQPQPDFKVPAGSRVLTPFSVATFSIPFANPGTVETLPAMEVGASDQRVQRLSQGLASREFGCGLAREVRVTHVVENQWVGEPPGCWRLLELKHGWRLWRLE